MIRIGDFAKICDTTVKAIRFYEKKKLLVPAEVDRWTGYRYYDEANVKRLSEILYLKGIGFSLKEILNLDERQIKQKTQNLKLQMQKIRESLIKIDSIHKNKEGDFIMKTFINDEQAIGKWEKVAVVKNKGEFYSGKVKDDKEIFPFKELYLMRNGEEYWVISWTKGFINIKDISNPYEIDDNIMFVGVVDRKDGKVYQYAVYKKLDSKEYNPEDIRIKDNVKIPFIVDKKAVGFWKVYDFINKPESFNPEKKQWQYGEFIFKSMSLAPDGEAIFNYNDGGIASQKWAKNFIINLDLETVSKYVIKRIADKNYLIMEWKSGDYMFAGKINGYYVFEQQK